MKQTYRLGLDELDVLARDVCGAFDDGVIVLQGDLASGKTTFVKKIADCMGIEDAVTSPTFSLQHNYADKIFHYDMYSHGIEHFISLGILEELERSGLHFVEWGDDELVKILNLAEIQNITIKIKKISDDKREYEVCTH